MKSIYFRNVLATATLVLCCFTIIGAAFFFLGRSYLINSTRESMNASADEVVRAAAAVSREESLSSWSLRMTISPIANSTACHIFISDQDGLVLSCSDLVPYCEHAGRQLDRTVVNTLHVEKKLDRLTTLAGFYPEQRLVVAKPIETDSGVIGYVFVSSDNAAVLDTWKTFIGVALTVGVAVMLIAMLMSLIFSKKMAEPLDQLTVASRKFALGDFSVRVENTDRRDDEIGTLLDSFNNMADSLERSDRKRQELIANISHELRTPMTTIAGFADGIIDGTIPREQEDKYLRKIADETRRLARLVRNMLDLSQAETKAVDKSKRKKFDLSELLLQTLLSFESRAYFSLDLHGIEIPAQTEGMNSEDLETFLEDGRLAISNNLCESHIRPFATARRAWLFADTPKGCWLLLVGYAENTYPPSIFSIVTRVIVRPLFFIWRNWIFFRLQFSF